MNKEINLPAYEFFFRINFYINKLEHKYSFQSFFYSLVSSGRSCIPKFFYIEYNRDSSEAKVLRELKNFVSRSTVISRGL